MPGSEKWVRIHKISGLKTWVHLGSKIKLTYSQLDPGRCGAAAAATGAGSALGLAVELAAANNARTRSAMALSLSPMFSII